MAKQHHEIDDETRSHTYVIEDPIERRTPRRYTSHAAFIAALIT